MSAATPNAAPAAWRPAQSRREELLAVAADLFASSGFASVTVDDIGAAAGISGPALYHHFDSKESILGEMLMRISEHLLAGARSLRETSPPADLLHDLIAMHVDFAVDQRALITVQFRDLTHARDLDQRRVRQLQRQYVEIWVGALVERSPSMSPATARTAANAAFGLINSTPFSARARRREVVELLTAMAAGALAAAERTTTQRADGELPRADRP